MTPSKAVELPRIEVGEWFGTIVEWCTDNLSWFFDGIGSIGEAAVEGLAEGLLAVPPLILVVILALIGLFVAGWKVGLFALIGFTLIDSIELWEPAMDTLALVLVSALVAVLISIPLGIAAARNDTVSRVMRPVLDLMQTMPAFVYLIPAIFFFSIGVVPGMVATVIFALPPGVRLTELGIRGVDRRWWRPVRRSGRRRAASSPASRSRWRCRRSWRASTS